MRDIPNEFPSSVAEAAKRLKSAREKVYPTAAQAARALGLNPVTVRAHENGQNGFQFSHADKYARAYSVSLGWLISGEGDGGHTVTPGPKVYPAANLMVSAAPVTMTSLGNGKARLEMNMVVPMGVALKVLGLVHGEPQLTAAERLARDMDIAPTEAARVLDPDWLRAELKKPGRSQSGLARAMGLAQSAVNHLVNGGRELKAREIEQVRAYLAETVQ